MHMHATVFRSSLLVSVNAKGYEIEQNVKVAATMLRLASFNVVANKKGRTTPNAQKKEDGRAFLNQFVGVIFQTFIWVEHQYGILTFQFNIHRNV